MECHKRESIKARFITFGGEDIEKKYDFVDEFNELEIKTTKKCICKVCDRQLENEKIVYIKSFRLHAQPFHICIPCWKQISKLVEEKEGFE